MNTTFIYHPLFLEHDTGRHPECPDRLRVLLDHLGKEHGDGFAPLEPRRADPGEAARIHDAGYLSGLEEFCRRGGGFLDADTPVSKRSFEAALYAAGALLDGAGALLEGRGSSVFALVRPPGHHARRTAAMGFCLINNIAVAAAHLAEGRGLSRLLIVDFDVHHGNGTQEAFYSDPAAFFLSLHRYPFYPGSGGADERGSGPGKGTTWNLPIPFGTSPGTILASFEDAVEKAAERHEPEMILVSAGFDGFAGDPVGGLGLEPDHYAAMGSIIGRAARRHCGGKILSTLEGGYSLEGLPACLDAYIEGIGRES